MAENRHAELTRRCLLASSALDLTGGRIHLG